MADESTGVTPAAMFKKQENRSAEAYHRDIIRARAEGHAEGRTAARNQMVKFLEATYLDPKLKRGTPDAVFVLKLTRELVIELKGKS